MTKMLMLDKIKIPITEYASQGNAVLGIRDSGKSYTATYIAERLLDAGIPFVVFDPIGIWKYLRVAGKKAGYPVVVAGGRNGDLPLTPQSAPEIVRAAMRDNIPLVIDLYDMKLSKADWKSIVEQSVRLLLYENGDHGLRHIFIEEAAEFAPQRIGPDQGRVYAEIEKLARMGGNAQLGYTLINQRAEEVNKAVLELCDCLFLHRQKGRNSLTALGKWLDIGSVSSIKPIMESLPLLPQGDCWVWVAGSNSPTRIHIPEKNTFHPDRRATTRSGGQVSFNAIDVSSFVSQMSASLAKHIDQAKENDPSALKREIVALKHQLSSKVIPQAKIEKVEVPVFSDEQLSNLSNLVASLKKLTASLTEETKSLALSIDNAKRLQAHASHRTPDMQKPSPITRQKSPSFSAETNDEIGVTAPQQRILDAVSWLESVRLFDAKRSIVAFLAEQSPKSSGFTNNLSALKSRGLIIYPDSKSISLTGDGRAAARKYDDAISPEQVQSAIIRRLPRPQARILEVLIGYYPNPVERSLVAELSDQSLTSSGFTNNLSALRSLGVIDYAGSQMVKALPVLFLE